MATSEHPRDVLITQAPGHEVSSPRDCGALETATEERLIALAQTGDRAAFTILVQRYWERLYRWLYHLTHDRHAAEDLAQDTFFKAFRHLARFRAGTNFRAWLFRIAHNSFANHHRARSQQREPLPEEIPDPHGGPVADLLCQETLSKLSQAVAQLPTEFRAALLLRAEEDLSFRQIADVLGLTEETARWRVFKARQKLLSTLGTQVKP